jgi:hypothetical protein
MKALKKLVATGLALSLPLAAIAQAPEAAKPAEPTAVAAPAPAPAPKPAIKFKFSGDLNNRFMLYTDQAGIYNGAETIAGSATNPLTGTVSKDTLEEAWGELKYRFTAEASTADDSVKGVYGVELGAIRFGDATRGGGYSGDGNNYETRFAYVDFGLPTAQKNRLTIGLQPFLVNKYLWNETATGVQLKGEGGPVKYTLAWMRGNEVFTSRTDQEVYADGDAYLLRGDFVPMADTKLGVFGLYQHRNTETTATGAGAAAANSASYLLKRFGANVDYDIFNVGADAGLKFGDIFVNADVIYQGGKILQKGPSVSSDLSAWFAHADVGVNVGDIKLTYTGWYATGDDNAADDKTENFIATDVDTFDSIILFEGGYTDDNYFTEAPYFLNAGAIFNKVAVDYKASPKLTVGVAAMYIMTAEDVVISDGSKTKEIGTELDGYASYKLTSNLELAVNAGYLFSGDAVDAFDGIPDGKADSDIFRTTARVRYQF